MITLTAYCMVSRNDKYSLEAISSIENAFKNENIKIIYSIKEDIYKKIKKIFHKKSNFLIYKNKYSSVFEHIKELINHCESDYIMILHDDDNIGRDFLISTYNILRIYNPDALSSRANYIDDKSRILKKKKIKSINKTYKISKRKILNRYFLPIKNGQTIFPTIAFKNDLYKKYWQEDKNFIGLHEDVKIVYYFSLRNKFFENGLANNFFYRLHNNQQSANKVSFDRLLLMKWITELKENIFYKFLLIIFSRLQYLLYYKDINLKSKILKELISKTRIKILNFRSGFY